MTSTPEQVRQYTNEVLARPEFQETQTLTQIVTERLLKWARELADWSTRNPELSKVLIAVLTIVLVLLIGHIIYSVVRESVSVRKSGGAGGRLQHSGALEGVAENWNEAFRLARTALDAGDLYRALWITHRVLLSVLDRIGEIRFTRWKTNTDYLRECGDSGLLGSTLLELSDAYERVIYAHTEFDRLQATKFLAQVEELAGKHSHS